MFGDLDWPIKASRGFVSISWDSCIITLWKHAPIYPTRVTVLN